MDKTVPLVKMNGIGNKIIVVDRRSSQDVLSRAAVLALSANKETEFDQIMVIAPPRSARADAFIEIWNRDATKAGACGNGMRCVVAYLAKGQAGKKFHFETAADWLSARTLGKGRVEVDMGVPAFDWRSIPTTRPLEDTLHVAFDVSELREGTLVSIGNPHCIFFITQDANDIKLETYGPILERDPLFADRANISIAQMISREEIQLRTWERGAGLTLACGSAACAASVAAVRRGLSERQVTVHLPGGDLQIEWDEKTGHVLMTGDTNYEFSGHVDPTTGDFIRD